MSAMNETRHAREDKITGVHILCCRIVGCGVAAALVQAKALDRDADDGATVTACLWLWLLRFSPCRRRRRGFG